MESCGMTFIKYLLFIFNVIFALSGLGLIIAGALVVTDVGDFQKFDISQELTVPAILLICVGAAVFIVASFGCYGAINESYKFLLTFAILLLIILIIELTVGIATAVFKNKMAATLKKTMEKSMANYAENPLPWDTVQRNLKCCGIEASSDWSKVPPSCCQTNDATDGASSDVCSTTTMYQIGCYDLVKMKINRNSKVLIGVGVGIAFVEVVGIILATWLAYTIKKEKGGGGAEPK